MQGRVLGGMRAMSLRGSLSWIVGAEQEYPDEGFRAPTSNRSRAFLGLHGSGQATALCRSMWISERSFIGHASSTDWNNSAMARDSAAASFSMFTRLTLRCPRSMSER